MNNSPECRPKPRVTWHSLPLDRQLGLRLFSQLGRAGEMVSKKFFEELRETPGQCGWVSFNNVRASAPSMGLVAASYAWSEALAVLREERQAASGMAYVWPSVLPFSREILRGVSRAGA
jgi:hypothetical protein